jgi:hypothetical protein
MNERVWDYRSIRNIIHRYNNMCIVLCRRDALFPVDRRTQHTRHFSREAHRIGNGFPSVLCSSGEMIFKDHIHVSLLEPYASVYLKCVYCKRERDPHTLFLLKAPVFIILFIIARWCPGALETRSHSSRTWHKSLVG